MADQTAATVRCVAKNPGDSRVALDAPGPTTEVATARPTFVAIDTEGEPRPVPALDGSGALSS
ncbi:hypothetical protein [Streptomyces subrutilus]|uniref:Uncharacterized protein n=1 Tax=Streptomyces subrutilus TaxID=36818 RepID=A0A1E5PZ05_9ACTN|nr:hypothetical protein [Streptomyces subrutilus]OEJ34733.1 hypothetical protein BGK67_28390 [Streptomyces subrutilus]